MSETPEIIYFGRFGKLLAVGNVAPERYLSRLLAGGHTYLFSVSSAIDKHDPTLATAMKLAMSWDRVKDDMSKAELHHGIR